MKKTTLNICFFLAMTSGAMAQEAGHNSYEFLALPTSSHASALGGDNVSLIEDDASLATLNPALLQSVGSRTVSLGYMNYMSGVAYGSANYAHPINEKATAGVIAQHMNYGKMKHTDAAGNILGDFSATDLAIGGQLSYTLSSRITGGVTAKFIYSNIGEYNSTAVAIDLGLNYYDPDRDFSASIVARNIGGQTSAFIEEYESLPADVIVGITKRLKDTPIRLSLTASDLTHLNYSLFKHLTIGADLILSDQIYIAGGYSLRRANEMKIQTNDDDGESSHGAGLSLGAGLQLEKFRVHVSYAKYHVSSSSILANISFTF